MKRKYNDITNVVRHTAASKHEAGLPLSAAEFGALQGYPVFAFTAPSGECRWEVGKKKKITPEDALPA